MSSFKYLGLDGIHPRVPKELADVIVWPLYEEMHMIRIGTQQPEKCWYYAYFKKGKKEDKENNRPVSLTSVPRQGREHASRRTLPDTRRTRRQSKRVNTGQADHAWSLTAFCNKMTCYVDEERQVDATDLDLLKFLTLWPFQTHLGVEELRARRTDS